MAAGFTRIYNGLSLAGQNATAVSVAGDIRYNSSTNKLELFNTGVDPLVSEAGAATLANKSLTAPTITGSGTITDATTIINASTASKVLQFNLAGSTASTTLTIASAQSTTQSLAIPNVSSGDSLVTNNTTATLANKSISGSTNTITNVSLTTGVTGTLPLGNGGTGQTSASAAFNALAPATAKGGLIVGSGSNAYTNIAVGADNKVAVADSTATNGLSFQFPTTKNYLSNPSFESNSTTNWSLGTVTLTSNLPTGVPTFGSGASGNLSIAATSSSPLAGSFSLSYVSSAATTAGNFLASNAFTIDIADQAKVLTFKFYYSATSGTANCNFSGTTSNSFGVAIYDVTNSAWIIPAGIFGMTQGTGVGYVTGTFQSTANSTQYRLVVYNANATAGAATIYFDDFYLGPQTAPIGPVVTDWTTFTPTGTWVSNTTYTGRYRRVGDSIDIYYKVALTGAPTATGLTLNMPPGFTIDTTKLNSPTTSGMELGRGEYFDNGVQTYAVVARYNGTNSGFTILAYAASGAFVNQSAVSDTNPFTAGNTDELNILINVPISGLSSNVQMSNDTDTRVVAFSGSLTTGTQTSSNAFTDVTTWVSTFDTHGAFSSGTTYTVPVSGKYSVNGTVPFASFSGTTSNVGGVKVLLNGSLSFFGSFTPLGASSSSTPFAGTIDCKAGDTIKIQAFQNSGGSLSYNSGNSGILNIQRLSGPAVVAATETVSARYFDNAGGISIPNNSATIANFGSKSWDTHNAVTTGASWKFTAPVSGKYVVAAAVRLIANTSTPQMQLFKNGSQFSAWTAGNNSTNGSITVVDTVSLVAGDFIDVRVVQASGGTTTNFSDPGSFISINRVGN